MLDAAGVEESSSRDDDNCGRVVASVAPLSGIGCASNSFSISSISSRMMEMEPMMPDTHTHAHTREIHAIVQSSFSEKDRGRGMELHTRHHICFLVVCLCLEPLIGFRTS
jgi:hypothetical protein